MPLVVAIVCPTSVSVAASPGATGARVNWQEPDLTGWNGPTNFTASADPGDVFPIGTHEVNYRQRFETYDLVLQCTFNVTIIGKLIMALLSKSYSITAVRN